jgi:hypothetical protein
MRKLSSPEAALAGVLAGLASDTIQNRASMATLRAEALERAQAKPLLGTQPQRLLYRPLRTTTLGEVVGRQFKNVDKVPFNPTGKVTEVRRLSPEYQPRYEQMLRRLNLDSPDRRPILLHSADYDPGTWQVPARGVGNRAIIIGDFEGAGGPVARIPMTSKVLAHELGHAAELQAPLGRVLHALGKSPVKKVLFPGAVISASHAGAGFPGLAEGDRPLAAGVALGAGLANMVAHLGPEVGADVKAIRALGDGTLMSPVGKATARSYLSKRLPAIATYATPTRAPLLAFGLSALLSKGFGDR